MFSSYFNALILFEIYGKTNTVWKNQHCSHISQRTFLQTSLIHYQLQLRIQPTATVIALTSKI